MNARLNLLLVTLTLAPLVALGFLGQKLNREADAEVAARFAALERNRLETLRGQLDELLEIRARALVKATDELPQDISSLRRLVRRSPALGQLMILDGKGRRVFPPLAQPLSEWEQRFLERTRGLWEGGALGPSPGQEGQIQGQAPAQATQIQRVTQIRQAPEQAPEQIPVAQQAAEIPQAQQRSKLSSLVTPAEDQYGWQPWFSGGGMSLIFWRRLKGPDGAQRTLGVEILGATLLSTLVAALPETAHGEASGEAGAVRTALLDARGAVLYQWGRYVPKAGEAPLASLTLSAPLGAWRLVSWTAPPPEAESGLALWAGLAAVALALIGLAILIHRESTRAITLAAQRVTFVNQVSHELKTPLTNIRMYAELLGEALDDVLDEDPRATRYMSIIVDESQRLSRMIGNVLSFARDQRQQLTLKPRPASVDAVVEAAVERFRPVLEAKGVAIALDAQAKATVQVDVDVLEQVVGNLLSNVEKYAESGVLIRTGQGADRSWIVVADQGPGVPASLGQRIFDPFYRVDDRLSAQASGTGIGLTISRRLARLHGGDLRLIAEAVEGYDGARFELSLHTPPA